jgi:hypothetical protein
MFLFWHLHFIDLIVEICIPFRLQKRIGPEHWAVCDASNYKNNFTKDFNNEMSR